MERIWTPDDETDLFRKVDQESVLKTVKATIVNAKYYPDKNYIIVGVKMQNGELRSCPQHESCFTYRGVPYKQASRELIEREMYKLEQSYSKARGKPILIQLPERKA